MSEKKEGEITLKKIFKDRRKLGIFVLFILLCVGSYFLYGLLPRQYTLTITGGEILGNRHFMAKMLQEEMKKNGVILIIHPLPGSLEATEEVSQGKLDLAFVQGGLDKVFSNVLHVATVEPEMLHLLVKPGINDIKELKGKAVNMGSREGGTRIVAHKVLKFLGLQEGIDYAETNYDVEKLASISYSNLPDAIFTLSATPSYLAEFLIKKRGYQLLEIPFPDALALRYGWVSDGQILAYTYSITPPVPEKDIKTVGVNMHLIANAGLDKKPILKILDVLYGPVMESKLHQKLNSDNITIPSGYPVSEATVDYLKRKDPLLSFQNSQNIEASLGLLMTLITAIMFLINWFRGGEPEEDEEFKGYIKDISKIEREIGQMEEKGDYDRDKLNHLAHELTMLSVTVLEKYPEAKLSDAAIMDNFLDAVNGTRNHVTLLLRQSEGAGRMAGNVKRRKYYS